MMKKIIPYQFGFQQIQWLIITILILITTNLLMAKSVRMEYYKLLQTKNDSQTEISIYKGKIKLSRKQALSQRHVIFIFNEHNQLLEIQNRNKKKFISSYLEASIIRFQYNKSGFLIQEAYYDAMNRLVSKTRNANIASIFTRYDNNNYLINKTYYDKKMRRTEDWQGISRLVYQYNRKGEIIEKSYHNKHDQLTENWLGIAITRYQYDSKGNQIKQSIYDKKKRLTENGRGIAITCFQWDNYKRLLKKTFYDKNNKLLNGIAYYCFKYYNDLGIIERLAYDKDNQLIDVQKGIAIMRWRKNKKWRLIETIINDQRNGLVLAKYDGSGRKTLSIQLNNNDQLMNFVKKPTIIQWYYDSKGRIIQKSYYNSEYERMAINGCSSQRWQYDHKSNIIEYAVYNSHYQLIKLIRYSYDKRGRLAELAYGDSISEYDNQLLEELQYLDQSLQHHFSLLKYMKAYLLTRLLFNSSRQRSDINVIHIIYLNNSRSMNNQQKFLKKWLKKPE